MTDQSNIFALKSKWNLFAATGVVIFTAVVSFMISPPQLKFDENSRIDLFIKFLLAGMVALLAIPMLKKSRKTNHQFWYRMSWVTIALSLVVLGFYTLLMSNWSVPYYNGKRLVIGKTMTAEAEKQKLEIAIKLNLPVIDDEILVKSRRGETQFIWPIGELQSRYYFLSVLYISCFLLFALFMLSVIQAIYCYEQEN